MNLLEMNKSEYNSQIKNYTSIFSYLFRKSTTKTKRIIRANKLINGVSIFIFQNSSPHPNPKGHIRT
ncbi:MAG: hypothetical protein ACK5UI_05685, partial [Bacteroidota bacterium]